MNSTNANMGNVGLGLKRSLLNDVLAALADGEVSSDSSSLLQFLEVAPENWIAMGGAYGRKFAQISEQMPIYLHGLSLNIGGYTPLDTDLLDNIKAFIKTHDCPVYSEHLTYCGDHGHLYDLLPIPFTEVALKRVVDRVKQVQDHLGVRLCLENASYYAAPDQEMSELEFINQVLERADCDLLLDVNNIYVNSINHRYDASEFLRGLPAERARYIHIAGHYQEAEDLRVDTHGADVIDDVWLLLEQAYEHCGVLPTLLERDFNIPPWAQLMQEVKQIHGYQQQAHNHLNSSAKRSLA